MIAGRTDTGVHALANVASVEVGGGPPPERAAEALNALLPDGSRVVRADGAPAGFNARHSARSRSYRYRIWRRRAPSPFETNRSLWHPRPLELQRLHASAAMLVGDHDFRAFTPTDTQHDVFVRIGRRRALARSRRHRRARDHRRLVPAPHGAGRSSARCSSSSPTGSSTCSRARPAPRPARPPRPAASISSASATTRPASGRAA